jgi:hypothetical protein
MFTMDAPAALTQQWEKGLSNCDLTDHVDLQLPPQLTQGQKFKRSRHGGASVVDEACESHAARGSCHRIRG